MTPWGFVIVALAGIVAPFFIAPLIDRTHPSFTPLGLGVGFALSLAFGAWRLADTLSRLDSVEASTWSFAFQIIMVAVFTFGTVALAGILMMIGVAVGGLLGRRFNRT